jgi:hypothetical protein
MYIVLLLNHLMLAIIHIRSTFTHHEYICVSVTVDMSEVHEKSDSMGSHDVVHVSLTYRYM